MAHLTEAPEFNVWSGPVDDEVGWVHRLTTSDLADAMHRAAEIGTGDTGSIVYEFGYFDVQGASTEGDLAFWWSDNLERSEGAPRGRGHGWSEIHRRYVAYTHPSLTVSSSITALIVPTATEPDRHTYAFSECDNCGLQVPRNELHRYSHWVAVGRSSGTQRTSSSQSYRVGSRSSSTTYRRGSSSTSGRTYYKHESLLLCPDCYKEQRRSDFLWLAFKVLLYGGGTLVLVAYLLSHGRR